MNSITRHRGGFASVDDSRIVDFSKRPKFLATYRRYQKWSLPDSIIYYITKNPSTPKYYEKMIKTCKYFFLQNPVLIVPCVSVFIQGGDWRTSFERYNHLIRTSDKIPLDLRNVKSKLWLTNEFDTNPYTPGGRDPPQNYLSFSGIISKIYQCDIKKLDLWYQNISFTDFEFLSLKAQQIWLTQVYVMNESGSILPLEKIVEALPLPNVKKFFYDHGDHPPSNIITFETASQLIKIPHFSNFDKFGMQNVIGTFDIDSFYHYMKKNKNTRFSLHFAFPISEAYKERLKTNHLFLSLVWVIDKLLQLHHRLS